MKRERKGKKEEFKIKNSFKSLVTTLLKCVGFGMSQKKMRRLGCSAAVRSVSVLGLSTP